MDYHTSSRNRTRKSSTEPSPPSSSSRHSSSSTSESASIRYYTALAGSSTPYRSPYEPTYTQDEDRRAEPSTASASRASAVSASSRSANLHPSYEPPSPPTKDSLSTGSLSSGGSLYTSSPTTQNYQGTPGGTGSSRGKTMSSNEKEQLLRSLRTHQVNTLTELRRIEKLFAAYDSPDITEAMTNAWAHYVNSNNLLSELRGMTKNYPFSSACLDAAKAKVIEDPESTRSWNYCWLILTKIESEGLIKEHARLLAAKPAMWGGHNPTASGTEQLATACQSEWTRAVDQMLRQWATPPCTR